MSLPYWPVQPHTVLHQILEHNKSPETEIKTSSPVGGTKLGFRKELKAFIIIIIIINNNNNNNLLVLSYVE